MWRHKDKRAMAFKSAWACLCGAGQMLVQLRDQMFSQFIHGEQIGAPFGIAVVIGVGVDVIDEGLARLVGDELKRRHIQPGLPHYILHFGQ